MCKYPCGQYHDIYITVVRAMYTFVSLQNRAMLFISSSISDLDVHRDWFGRHLNGLLLPWPPVYCNKPHGESMYNAAVAF